MEESRKSQLGISFRIKKNNQLSKGGIELIGSEQQQVCVQMCHGKLCVL